MEQFLPSFHNKPSVTIAGVSLWEFYHHSGMLQYPSPGAPACSTEPVWGVVHPGCWANSKSPLWPHCRNQTPSDTSQQLKPFLGHSAQAPGVCNIYPWHGISLKNLFLGPVIPCLPDFSKIKRNKHLLNLSQAAAITGPKRCQTDLLHILFNNHHFFKDTFFHSSQAHFADRQKVNLRPVFC